MVEKAVNNEAPRQLTPFRLALLASLQSSEDTDRARVLRAKAIWEEAVRQLTPSSAERFSVDDLIHLKLVPMKQGKGNHTIPSSLRKSIDAFFDSVDRELNDWCNKVPKDKTAKACLQAADWQWQDWRETREIDRATLNLLIEFNSAPPRTSFPVSRQDLRQWLGVTLPRQPKI